MISALLFLCAIAGPNASRDIEHFFVDEIPGAFEIDIPRAFETAANETANAVETAFNETRDFVQEDVAPVFEREIPEAFETAANATANACETAFNETRDFFEGDFMDFLEEQIAGEVKCWLLKFITDKLTTGLGCAAIAPLVGAAATVQFGTPVAGGIAAATVEGLCAWVNMELNNGNSRQDIISKANC